MADGERKRLFSRIRSGWKTGLAQGDTLVWLGTVLLAAQFYLLFFFDLQHLDFVHSIIVGESVASAPPAAAPASPAAAAPAAARPPPPAAPARQTRETRVTPEAARAAIEAARQPQITVTPPQRTAPPATAAAPTSGAQACTVARAAGNYQSQYGPIACEARGNELRCCYGGFANCQRQLHLRPSRDAPLLVGQWIYRSGERGPAAFAVTPDCSLGTGRWGRGAVPDQRWEVRGRS